MPKSPLPSGGNTADEKEKTGKAEEVQRKPSDLVDSCREEEDRMLQDTSKRRVSVPDRYAVLHICVSYMISPTFLM
jgi:hypothetical protein